MFHLCSCSLQSAVNLAKFSILEANAYLFRLICSKFQPKHSLAIICWAFQFLEGEIPQDLWMSIAFIHTSISESKAIFIMDCQASLLVSPCYSSTWKKSIEAWNNLKWINYEIDCCFIAFIIPRFLLTQIMIGLPWEGLKGGVRC